MVDINYIRENPTKIQKACQAKGADVDINKLLDLDKKRRNIIQEKQELESRQNSLSKQIPNLDDKEKKEVINKAKYLSQSVSDKQEELNKIEEDFYFILKRVPNPAFDEVKVGKDDSENEIIEEHGDIREFDFKPKDHLELGEDLDIIDTKRAAKVSG